MKLAVRWNAVRLVLAMVALLVVSCGDPKRALAAPPPSTPSHAEARVAAALFTPARTDDGFDWHAHWVLTPESAAEVEGGATAALHFAIPLADGENVETTWGVAPLMENGHVAGVLVDRAALDVRTIRAVVHQRATFDGDVAKHLGAPVAAGTSLQILDGDLGAGTRFEIETGRSLERRVGYVAPVGISHAAREEARRLTGYDARVTGAALYVRGDDVKASSGLRATVVTPRARARHTTTAIALVFAGIVIALFAAVRRLRHAASVERADALLAAEVDSLDRGRAR